MKLAMMLNYSGDFHADVTRIQELEKAGLDLVWVAEAYSYDAISQVGFLAAKTERVEIGTGIINVFSRTATAIAQTAAGCDFVSDGRFILGLGASGPQVIEGFHGVPYEHPMPRIREYIEVCRMVWRREPVVYDGQTVQIPLPAGQGTGLGKPLKLINHPKRADIPIFWASLMGKSVTETASYANGWLPIFFDPEKFQQVWGDDLRAGLADRDPSLGPLQISAGGMVAIGDEYAGEGADRVLDMARPTTALYVGGMGARDKNFYNTIAKKYGYVDEATEIQDLYLVRAQGRGRRGRAARAARQHQPRRPGVRTSPSASPPTRRPASPTCRSTRSAPTRSRRSRPCARCSTDSSPSVRMSGAGRADRRSVDAKRSAASDHAAEPPQGEGPGGGEQDEGAGGPAPRQLGDDLDLLAERVAEAVADAARRRRRARCRSPPRRPRRRWPRRPAASGSGCTGTGTTSPLSGSVIDPSGVPKAIVNTGTPASAASWAPSSVGRPTVVSPSDSSTIAPGRRPRRRRRRRRRSRASASPAQLREQVGPVGQGVADRRRLGQLEVLDAPVEALRGRVSAATSDGDVAAEGDQPDLDVGVDLVDELAGRRLGGLEAGRVDVGGHHRQRHVEQHEDAPLALGALGRRGDRSGDGHDAGREAEQLDAGDDVAAPAGPRRRDAVEQVDLGEAHRRPPAPALHGDVGDAQGGDGEQPPQALGVRGSRDHGGSSVRGRVTSTWALTAWLRLRVTWLTMAASQSPSVASSIRSAPARRMANRRRSTSSAAAAA